MLGPRFPRDISASQADSLVIPTYFADLRDIKNVSTISGRVRRGWNTKRDQRGEISVRSIFRKCKRDLQRRD